MKKSGSQRHLSLDCAGTRLAYTIASGPWRMRWDAALSGVMQFALFGLLTAILALKGPYFTLDLWVQRSTHVIGLSPTVWAGDRLNVCLLNRDGFFPPFNQFCHVPVSAPCRFTRSKLANINTIIAQFLDQHLKMT